MEITTEVKSATLREWMLKRFDDNALYDIYRNGAARGLSGLTYGQEACELYQQYKQEIWSMLRKDTHNMGYHHILEFIATFNMVVNIKNAASFEYLLVCYAAEKIARHAVEESHEFESEMRSAYWGTCNQ